MIADAHYIGLMSGTSADGVDGVLADLSSPIPVLIAHHFIPFPDDLKAQVLGLQSAGDNELERCGLLNARLAGLYAECVKALLSTHALPVRAIGVHGQTLRHRPELGYTWQANNPALLAELTGIDVIADFRSRDVAAGGQGAPLVPAFHRALWAQAGQDVVVVNIGGISNVSVLAANGRTVGWDTGPGNVLLDGWMMRHHGQAYDKHGAWGATGHVHAGLLSSMLSDPYFEMPAPKSTGRDLFNMAWLDGQLARVQDDDANQDTALVPETLAPQDVQATLVELTAHSIARDVLQHVPQGQILWVCGGGAYNHHLMLRLSALLPRFQVASTARLGMAPEHVEAFAFAWLAQRFIHGLPGNLSQVTGASGERILGALYPA